MPRLHPIMLLAIASVPVAVTPALSEENRLLPFWAQPYPAGYVLREPGNSPFERDCRTVRRVRVRHGARTAAEDRCRPVLHARD